MIVEMEEKKTNVADDFDDVEESEDYRERWSLNRRRTWVNSGVVS